MPATERQEWAWNTVYIDHRKVRLYNCCRLHDNDAEN